MRKLTRDLLHEYQDTAVKHIKKLTHCGLFLEMGLGKTVSTLTAIIDLIDDFEIDTVLVIAPKRVAENVWSSEVKKWAHLQHLTVERIRGSQHQRRHALNASADIYTIGRDNVAWLCAEYGGSSLPFDMLVIDESSSFKNHKSVRFRALRQVQASFSRVVILTGTPAPNTLIDLWSQIYLLDRGERLGKFIGHYRSEYFRPGQSKGNIVYNYKSRKGSEERIYKQIEDICMSMKVKDYLKLPKRINNFIELKFSEKLSLQYLDFERAAVMELLETDGVITAQNAAALSNKLLQFSNGVIYDEDKDEHAVHNLKLDAAEEIVEAANGNPVLIAWNYRSDMKRLKKRLKKYGVKELKSEQDIDDWNDGKIPVMLMHPASGGHGLNLQKGGSTIIWYGLNWSLELYQQFNARLHRQGQTKPTIVHHIMVEGTIDENVMQALNRKVKTQDALMKAVKARIKQYESNSIS